MKLSDATFSATRGCIIQIDGMSCDINTKRSLLMDGVCFITALDAKDAEKVDALMLTPTGQDGTLFGCNDPRLVELAARYDAWMFDDEAAPWEDTQAAPIADPVEAAMAFQRHLSTLDPA